MLHGAKRPYRDERHAAAQPRGSFSRAAWKLNIRKATVDAPSLSNDEAGEVAKTVALDGAQARRP
jgi:hypothetical protein